MKLVIIDNNQDFQLAAANAFGGDPERVYGWDGDWKDAEFDVVVSPANSYGLMDGGFDLELINHFGLHIEEAIQRHIFTRWHGEQPIGTSMLVAVHDEPQPEIAEDATEDEIKAAIEEATKDFKQQYIAHTPTMRLPEVSVGTDHPYVAMRAVLREVANFDDSLTIATTGLGTGCGEVPFHSAAEQMALAWRHHHAMSPVRPGDSHRNQNWEEARKQYVEVQNAVGLHLTEAK